MNRLPFAAALLAAFALSLPAPAADTTNIEGADTPQTGFTESKVPHEPIPPPPAGYVLDAAHALLPAAAAEMSARLVTAGAADVHVYAITVVSLGVPASKQSDRIQQRARDFAAEWLKEKVGAIVLFDDEGGLMTVELSKETGDRFTVFAVEDEMKAALSQVSERDLARDKLVATCRIVADALMKRQSAHAKDAHRQHIANLTIGVIALIGVGLAIFSAVGQPKKTALSDSNSAAESKPPTDF